MQPGQLSSARIRRVALAVAFIIVAPLVCHLLFSHLGFNPTDDGWILAGSRRVLEGEVPHRDFISIRPAGSHILHAPLLLLGGDRVIWISRYVAWLQLACVAAAWAAAVDRSLGRRLSRAEWFAYALIAFCFSTHIFPIMPWHTIDGVFFASLGMLLAQQESRIKRGIGLLLVGMAPLFRQNLVLLIPGTLILLREWRRKSAWVVACLPGASYVIYLAINRALADAMVQLSSYGFLDLARRGFAVYMRNLGFLVGTLLGCLGAYLYSNNPVAPGISGAVSARTIAQLSFILVPVIAIISLVCGDMLFTREPSFLIFGTVAGAMLFWLARRECKTPYLVAEALALLLAWAASLSTGYNTPALMSGPLVLFLVTSADASAFANQEAPRRDLSRAYLTRIPLFALLGVTLVSFGVARIEYIYNEKPACHLTYDLGDVLPGGAGIKTNNNTYAVLRDFQLAKQMAGNTASIYCVVPDLSATWIRSLQPNPLSIDWPQATELKKMELVRRVETELESLRGNIVVIVQKFRAESLARGLIPLPMQHSPLIPYVVSRFKKIAETSYFELYA